jgi:hypothetical protein
MRNSWWSPSVRMVEDHVLVYPVHPGEHALAAIALHFEIVRASVPALQRTEPHHLTAVVDDHRAALPNVSLLRADEYVARGCVVRLSGYLDGGWAEVGARAEVPHAVLQSGLRPVGDRPNGLRGLAGLRGLGLWSTFSWFAAHRVCQREVCGPCARGHEKPTSCELGSHPELCIVMRCACSCGELLRTLHVRTFKISASGVATMSGGDALLWLLESALVGSHAEEYGRGRPRAWTLGEEMFA